LEQYLPQNILDEDEITLLYNAQPNKILAIKGETCHEGKKCYSGVMQRRVKSYGHLSWTSLEKKKKKKKKKTA
jgi:hypothetical protein